MLARMRIGLTHAVVKSVPAQVAAIVAASGGVMLDGTDGAALRTERDGTDTAAQGGPVGAFIDKAQIAGSDVAGHIATHGLGKPLAALSAR